MDETANCWAHLPRIGYGGVDIGDNGRACRRKFSRAFLSRSSDQSVGEAQASDWIRSYELCKHSWAYRSEIQAGDYAIHGAAADQQPKATRRHLRARQAD